MCAFCSNTYNRSESTTDAWTCSYCYGTHENVWPVTSLSWYDINDMIDEFRSVPDNSYYPIDTRDGLAMCKTYIFEDYHAVEPDFIGSGTMVCCNELAAHCSCPSGVKTSWGDIVVDVMIDDEVDVEQLYHPDTVSACRDCEWFANEQCQPLREMLWAKHQGFGEYEMIVSCSYFYAPDARTTRIDHPKRKGKTVGDILEEIT